MKKRVIVLFVALVICMLAFSACGGDDKKGTPDSVSTTQSSTVKPTEKSQADKETASADKVDPTEAAAENKNDNKSAGSAPENNSGNAGQNDDNNDGQASDHSSDNGTSGGSSGRSGQNSGSGNSGQNSGSGGSYDKPNSGGSSQDNPSSNEDDLVSSDIGQEEYELPII